MLYMAATRTQIYLTAKQRAKLEVIMRRDNKALAQIIRDAVDAYLMRMEPDPGPILASTFGSMPHLTVPPRDEWDRG